MFAVYVLRSKSSGRIYVGQSENLERRLSEHQHGLARYTRGRGPWELVHVEGYLKNRSDGAGEVPEERAGPGMAQGETQW